MVLSEGLVQAPPSAHVPSRPGVASLIVHYDRGAKTNGLTHEAKPENEGVQGGGGRDDDDGRRPTRLGHRRAQVDDGRIILEPELLRKFEAR